MTAAAVADAKINLVAVIQETPPSTPGGSIITTNDFTLTQFLSPASTPSVTFFSLYKTTISGGTYNIDLTTAQGTDGNTDLTAGGGKNARWLFIDNPATSAGSVTVATGGSNGYAIGSYVVPIGGSLRLYLGTAMGAADSTHKIITVTGTTGDTPEIGLLFG